MRLEVRGRADEEQDAGEKGLEVEERRLKRGRDGTRGVSCVSQGVWAGRRVADHAQQRNSGAPAEFFLGEIAVYYYVLSFSLADYYTPHNPPCTINLADYYTPHTSIHLADYTLHTIHLADYYTPHNVRGGEPAI